MALAPHNEVSRVTFTLLGYYNAGFTRHILYTSRSLFPPEEAIHAGLSSIRPLNCRMIIKTNSYLVTVKNDKNHPTNPNRFRGLILCPSPPYTLRRLMYSVCLFCFQLLATPPPPPPPLSTLPSRLGVHSTPTSNASTNFSESNLESPPPLPSRNPRTVTSPVLGLSPTTSPPPLPPRQYLHSNSNNVDGCQDSVVCTDLSVSTIC